MALERQETIFKLGSQSGARYWCAVACRDHVKNGIAGGFAQVCHGKRKPLDRMKPLDGIVYYSPTHELNRAKKCQSFTAIGYIGDGPSYPYRMNDDFVPFRRPVSFLDAEDAAIQPLLPELSFTKNVTSWGYKFRFGLFEITEEDFLLILSRMKPNDNPANPDRSDRSPR